MSTRTDAARSIMYAGIVALLDRIVDELDHKAFICHTHTAYGKGREQGLLDAVGHVAKLSKELKRSAEVCVPPTDLPSDETAITRQ